MRSEATLSRAAIAELREGWRIVCASFLGMLFACIPGSAIGLFITPWNESNGWSLSAIGAFAFFLGLGDAVAEPFMGRLMDCYGARHIILAYILASSLCVAAMSLIGRNIWGLYGVMLAWGCIGAGGNAYVRLVSSRFTRARGTALGLVFIGIGIGGGIGPRVGQWMVDGYGPRAAWMVLAATSLLAWPFAWAWLHDGANRNREP